MWYFLTIFPLLDENAELKSQYSELNRRFHELEIEYRRLENEREELAAAYKESEAVRIPTSDELDNLINNSFFL